MVYFDLPRWALSWKRGQLGIELYYDLWHRLTRRIVRDLDREVGLDLTHHVTFGRYWGPTSLAYISRPFVWGPVGGGETAPAAFRADFGWRGRTYESLRHTARRCGEWAPSVRRTARRAALGLAVTPETRARMLALGTKHVELFSAMGFDRVSYDYLANLPSPSSVPLRFISIGRLLHWKGFHLGLKAFAAAAIPHSEYWIVGDGPEASNLANLVRTLGLESRVRFCGAQPRTKALEMLAASHVLVHPSVHDSGGWVCLEAMAAAKPVLCLDLGGPAQIVTDTTGVIVAAENPGQSICDLAQAMTQVGTNAEVRRMMGDAGRARVRHEFMWEQKGQRLDDLYASVLTGTSAPQPVVA
jgi:glycosyltransferase involved in cell wall biosynthesis